MNVKELIESLSKLPPRVKVVVLDDTWNMYDVVSDAQLGTVETVSEGSSALFPLGGLSKKHNPKIFELPVAILRTGKA